MFKSIQPCIEEHLKVVRAIEVALLSDTLKLAGRTDIIGTWDDYNSVIDIKTSTRVKKENDILDYFLQCTAYAIMFEELTGIDTPKIVVVIANEYQPPSIFVKDTSEYKPILMEYLAEYNP
jgi:genome maintenance exonuclease 1